MLNTIGLATSLAGNDGEISPKILDEALQSKTQLYDKTGDYHYDAISAFIKSVRGVIRMHPFIGLRSCWKVAKNPNLLHGG